LLSLRAEEGDINLMNIHIKKAREKSAVLFTVTFIGFLVLVGSIGYIYTNIDDKQRTVRTEGRIEKADCHIRHRRTDCNYTVFFYDAEGKKYTFVTGLLSHQGPFFDIISTYKEGDREEVLYNPQNPNDAKLSRVVHEFLIFMLPVPALICFLLGLWAFIKSLSNLRKIKKNIDQ